MSTPYDILVVEDEPAIRNLIAFALEPRGYRVRTFGGAFEALHHLEKNPIPSLILLDLSLGMTDGRTLRQWQQEDARLSRIPCILVSGSPYLEAEATRMGADGWLAKPINLRVLLNTVAKYCAPPRVEPKPVYDSWLEAVPVRR